MLKYLTDILISLHTIFAANKKETAVRAVASCDIGVINKSYRMMTFSITEPVFLI